MQHLRFSFAIALLYMFRVTIKALLFWYEDVFVMVFLEPAHLWPYTALYS